MVSRVLRNLRGRRSGEECAILCPGPSLRNYDLAQILVPTITANEAWMDRWPTWACILEIDQLEWYPGVYRQLHAEGRLFVAGRNWPIGNVVPFREEEDCGGFSLDIEKGAVCGSKALGVGSTALFALQLAAHLGFGTIQILGLDLGGGHIPGVQRPSSTRMALQDALFRNAAPRLEAADVKVWTTPESGCTAFEKRDLPYARPS